MLVRYFLPMPKLFSPNIDRAGRIVRAILGSLLVAGGVAACFWNFWAGAGLISGGAFAVFEAIRGWCVMRACGVKTRI